MQTMHWDEIENDKRRVVVDILPELWSHRFEKFGALIEDPQPENTGLNRRYFSSDS